MEVITRDARQTQGLGQKIASDLKEGGRGKQAIILALRGELGSGKTTFVQGVAKGFGLPQRILSPTFIVVRRYGMENQKFSWLYHIDLYRIKEKSELIEFGFDEIFADPQNVILIEWPEILVTNLFVPRIEVSFKTQDETIRLITIDYELRVKLLSCHSGVPIVIGMNSAIESH